jgi:hypothetical protein
MSYRLVPSFQYSRRTTWPYIQTQEIHGPNHDNQKHCIIYCSAFYSRCISVMIIWYSSDKFCSKLGPDEYHLWDMMPYSMAKVYRRFGVKRSALLAAYFLLVAWMAYSLNLKVEAVPSSEVTKKYQNTRRLIPRDNIVTWLWLKKEFGLVIRFIGHLHS